MTTKKLPDPASIKTAAVRPRTEAQAITAAVDFLARNPFPGSTPATAPTPRGAAWTPTYTEPDWTPTSDRGVVVFLAGMRRYVIPYDAEVAVPGDKLGRIILVRTNDSRLHVLTSAGEVSNMSEAALRRLADDYLSATNIRKT